MRNSAMTMTFLLNKKLSDIDIKICIVYVTLFMAHSSNIKADAQNNSDDNKPPNVIIIMADDMGFNDVSFHGSNQFFTPNIDALAYHGVILNHHYTAPLCTPSRSAFMTGKYPFNLGMQHSVIRSDEPWGLGLNEKLLPQYFKEAGYDTHLVGKWHLGFYKEIYTPTHRGFNTHFGYLGPHIDYYSHRIWYSDRNYSHALDMRSNLALNYSVEGKYAINLLTSAAIDVIDAHANKAPLFLMLNHLAPHAGNEDNPFQAPEEEIQKFGYIKDVKRRTLAAVVSILDKEVGRVIQKLEEKKMLENSIIIFFSDNGAPSIGLHSNAGSNFPLRGQKNTPFNGGVRTPSLIWSPLIKSPNRVFNGLFHVSDWLPTLLHATGFNINLTSIDGMSQWNSITKDTPNERKELAINIDEKDGYASIIMDQYKLINGTTQNGQYDIWMGLLDQTEIVTDNYESSVQNSTTFQILQSLKNETPEINIASIRESASVTCVLLVQNKCDPLVAPCLFDLNQDPCESNNIALSKPHKLAELLQRLDELQRDMLPRGNKPLDPFSNPMYHNNTWEWWIDTTEDDWNMLVQVQKQIKIEIDSARQSTDFHHWITTAILIALTGLCIISYLIVSAIRRNRYRRK